MAKFDAGTAVEALEWDFSAYGGDKGVIPEPSTAQVNGFFKATKNLVKEVRRLSRDQEAPKPDLDPDKLTDEDLDMLTDQIEATGKIAEEYQAKTRELLAELCSDQPTADQLAVLPQRVLAAFSTWLIGELRPKREAPATSR